MLIVSAGFTFADEELSYPPELPGGEEIVRDTSEDFITVPEGVEFREGTEVAQTPPTIDFAYFPGQNYHRWTNWGGGLGVGEHLFYTSIGDHEEPDRRFRFERLG